MNKIAALFCSIVLALLLLLPPDTQAYSWKDYKGLLERRYEEFEALGKWGNTAFPPKGMLAMKYQYAWVHASERFDENGERTKAVPPLDILGSELDFGLSGKGSGHKFQFFYGITNNIAVALEIPIQELKPSFDIKFTPLSGIDGILIGNLLRRYYKGYEGVDQWDRPSMADPDEDVALEALWLTFEALGRPRPNLTVGDVNQEIGDISLAFAWNYRRTENTSYATGFKVGFPTGKVADADNSLTYALGPEIDVGLGSYSIEVGHIFDIRPPKPYRWFIISVEAYANYYFKSKRDAPSTFTVPDPELQSVLDFLEPIMDLDDINSYFPDLSLLSGEIDYTPGAQLKWVLQFVPTLAWWFPFSFGVTGIYFDSSKAEGNVPEFQDLVDALGLVGKAHRYELWGKIQFGLFPLGIPATVSMGFNHYLAGENVLILEDNYDFTCQVYVPWLFKIPGL
ncbi:hypothetical protein ACFL4G_05770 [Thermodesulfobacteriota bacterium]